MDLRLYTYFRSSAAWRVRIALACKGLTVESIPVDLRKGLGEQHSPSYLALNPQALVPALVADGRVLTQSVAICEYLEERFPDPPLLPQSDTDRARVRAIVQTIACDVHPLNNLRVLLYLKNVAGLDQEAIDAWYAHWIHTGFAPLESMLATEAGTHCLGNTLSMADVFLVPQVANARRFKVALDAYPTIVRIDASLAALPCFSDTAPARQADAA